MLIFLDESGDLGWSFDRPNHDGGSSRYITIGGIVIENEQLKYLKRHVADIYKLHGLTPGIETKGASFNDDEATQITKSLFNKLKAKAPSFHVIGITAKKENVNQTLRSDPNIFYNYMLGVMLPDTIRRHDQICIYLDKRTIKVKSGRSFSDYIKVKCWGELAIHTSIDCHYAESVGNQGIWVADWMANFIWRQYENGRAAAYNVLDEYKNNAFYQKTLFMGK